MNPKQWHTWREIVEQCESRTFSSINVASERRSGAILAADALVGLVTPELAELLDRLAKFASGWGPGLNRAAETARELAARIREALDDSKA